MTDSVKRVVMRLEVDGQSSEISRTTQAKTHWDDVPDAQVIAFARAMTDRALHALGFSDEQIRRAVLADD